MSYGFWSDVYIYIEDQVLKKFNKVLLNLQFAIYIILYLCVNKCNMSVNNYLSGCTERCKKYSVTVIFYILYISYKKTNIKKTNCGVIPCPNLINFIPLKAEYFVVSLLIYFPICCFKELMI